MCTVATVHRMSIYKSEHKEMKNWEEAASRPRSREVYLELEEEAEALRDQPKFLWSIGIRKMEEQQEKPSGVTFS